MNLFFRYLEMISRYQEMISRYPEISRITDIGKWFPDIGKSGSGVELPHLAFTTDDDEVATVVPPGLSRSAPGPSTPMQYRPEWAHKHLSRRHETLEIQ